MYQVTVTANQARLLTDVIDMHLQGIAEAKGLTELDPTVATAEQLLDLMSGYDDDVKDLKIIRDQLGVTDDART